ncbi:MULTISPECIES: site-2 protease family protein [unclassified Leptolyngbya]|uniref:site-2 protease family protein n=1 Tax=unclassified Leptolyngbya TaxID=2650499 RepID=UPI0016899972|nr:MULTISPECIES: site-2 protease family protein [unclassified Leptolyngbya]MBD1911206.1 site-2 protease family protein [Leptolyngbya sp. FACHB-8]MBD2155453.1 site-2 protease family protein [Leptolyngbya sp. FACHB-16]
MIIILILLVALGVLVWGFNRARPYGKPGLLAWLQSVVLMAPWLLVFSLFSLGIFINLAAILVILVLSTVAYIYLGNQLRALGQDASAFRRPSAVASEEPSGQTEVISSSEAPSPTSDVVKPTLAVEKIPAEDLQKIKEIFGVDTFFAIETIPYMDGAIFKGNLRGDAAETHQSLSARLEERMGDRYRLFLLNDPTERPTVVILPSQNDPKPTTLTQKLFALVLALATLATCLEAAGILLGFDLSTEVARIPETLAIGGGLLSILAVHEVAHRWVARRYQVRLSPPFFLPAWQLGSLGSLVRFESLLPNRNVLFDISLAGPAAGGLLAFIFLIIGLSLSHQGGIQTGSLFPLQSEFFQGSILVGTMARIILGEAVQQPYIEVHPLVVVGWLGLIINAINLMPAGQLDGGRIVQAIYGRKVAGRTTAATLIILGVASLVNPLALYWAIVILFLQRDLERPALNELTEPDDARAAFALLALFLMAATLLPLTPGLSGRLGIGG